MELNLKPLQVIIKRKKLFVVTFGVLFLSSGLYVLYLKNRTVIQAASNRILWSRQDTVDKKSGKIESYLSIGKSRNGNYIESSTLINLMGQEWLEEFVSNSNSIVNIEEFTTEVLSDGILKITIHFKEKSDEKIKEIVEIQKRLVNAILERHKILLARETKLNELLSDQCNIPSETQAYLVGKIRILETGDISNQRFIILIIYCFSLSCLLSYFIVFVKEILETVKADR